MKLEPMDFTCRYCKRIEADRKKYNYIQEMENVPKHTNAKLLELLIPRCKACYYIHLKSKIFAWIICIILAFTAMVISFTQYDITVFTVTTVFALCPIIVYVYFLKNFITKTYNILEIDQGLGHEPIFQAMLKDEWEIYTPFKYFVGF